MPIYKIINTEVDISMSNLRNSRVEEIKQDLSESDLSLSFDTTDVDQKYQEMHAEMASELTGLLTDSPMPSPKGANKIVTGRIIAVNKKQGTVTVDVNLKSEAIVPYPEFFNVENLTGKEPQVGEEYEFYIRSFETRNSVLSISRSKVQKEKTWQKIQTTLAANEIIDGIIFVRMKGGFCVDFDGNFGFLPASQAKINFATKGNELIGEKKQFKVLNVDARYKTCIVSQLAALDEMLSGQRAEFIEKTKEGDEVEGIVKSITNYGAFVDLGFIDGLLHITDTSWDKISHPSEVLEIGQKLKLKVVKVDHAAKRLSLGLKQMTANPNAFLEEKYKVGQPIKGKVLNITDYGAFIEIEPGLEGLMYVYDTDWSKDRAIAFLASIETGTELDVVISAVDINGPNKILLSRKQLIENPWQKFIDSHKFGDVLNAEVKRVESYRLLVALDGGINGIVQIEDLAWVNATEDLLKEYTDGQQIQVAFLSGKYEDRQPRINLGIKQLSQSPLEKYKNDLAEGAVVDAEVVSTDSSGINVMVFGIFPANIKKAQLASNKTDQRSERFKVGSKVQARVIKFNESNAELSLSIRKLEEEEKDKILKEYSSDDSDNGGATLGSIIGDAFKVS